MSRSRSGYNPRSCPGGRWCNYCGPIARVLLRDRVEEIERAELVEVLEVSGYNWDYDDCQCGYVTCANCVGPEVASYYAGAR